MFSTLMHIKTSWKKSFDVGSSILCLDPFHPQMYGCSFVAMKPCQVIFSMPLVDAESTVKNNPSLQALTLAMFIWVH
jgi:hypothetical protein